MKANTNKANHMYGDAIMINMKVMNQLLQKIIVI